MSFFDVLYRSEADGPFKRLRRTRRKFLFFWAYLLLLPVLVIVLPIVFWDGSPPGAFMLVIFSVMVGAVFGVAVMTLRFFKGRRTSPPPVALRLSPEGVGVWPMVGADFFLPWLYVGAIQTSPEGIAVFARKGVGPDTPGTAGLANKSAMLLIRGPHLQHKEGLDWQSLEPIDVDQFDAAARAFSAGRVPVLRR